MLIRDQDYKAMWGFEIGNAKNFRYIRVDRYIKFKFYDFKIGFQYLVDAIF